MNEGVSKAIGKIKDDAMEEENRLTVSKMKRDGVHDNAGKRKSANESDALMSEEDGVSELGTVASSVEAGITLDDLMQVFRQRYLTVLAGALIGLAVVAAVLAGMSPIYAVSAKVVISRQDPGELVNTDSGSAAFIATQAEVMSGMNVVAKAVATLPRPDYLEPGADAVEAARAAVQASAIANTRVVALAYLGPDGDYGAALLRAMVDAYANELRDANRSGQVQALNTKAAELDTLLEKIAKQEAQIAELRAANNIIGTADESAAAQSALLRDQTEQLTEVRSRRMELERRLDTGGSAGLSMDDRRDRRSLREDLQLAEAELARVSRTLTAEHPSVVAARNNVEILRDQLADSDKVALEDQIAEVAGYEAELKSLVAEASSRLEIIESHRRVENDLLTELAQNRLLADSWQQELSELRLGVQLAEQGNVGVNVRFADEPVVPEVPVWPRPKQLLPAGLVFGTIAGFVFGLVSLHRRRVSTRAANS